MKYSVVRTVNNKAVVLLTYPFQWMARAMAAVHGGEEAGFDIAITPTKAQTVINICGQRDEAVMEAMEYRRELRLVRDRAQELADALVSLVARNDAGKWSTIHEADTELPEDLCAVLDRITAA